MSQAGAVGDRLTARKTDSDPGAGERLGAKKLGQSWAECVQGRGLLTWGEGVRASQRRRPLGQGWDLTWPQRRGISETWGKASKLLQKETAGLSSTRAPSRSLVCSTFLDAALPPPLG